MLAAGEGLLPTVRDLCIVFDLHGTVYYQLLRISIQDTDRKSIKIPYPPFFGGISNTTDSTEAKLTIMKFLIPTLLLPALAYSSQAPIAASPLTFSVYHTDETPVNYPPHPGLTFSPISITLVQSSHEILLVDAPISIAQTNSLIDFIKQTVPTKRPTALYITHGHGDHFFGAPLLRQAFPGLKVLATQKTIEHIKDTLEPETFATVWEALFPGQIPDQAQVLSFIETLPSDGNFTFAGHQLSAVELGETDTYNSSALHVPDIGLVVAGDTVYGHYYQVRSLKIGNCIQGYYYRPPLWVTKICARTTCNHMLIQTCSTSPNRILQLFKSSG